MQRSHITTTDTMGISSDAYNETTFGKLSEFHAILQIPLLELVDFYYNRVKDKASLQTFAYKDANGIFYQCLKYLFLFRV